MVVFRSNLFSVDGASFNQVCRFYVIYLHLISAVVFGEKSEFSLNLWTDLCIGAEKKNQKKEERRLPHPPPPGRRPGGCVVGMGVGLGFGCQGKQKLKGKTPKTRPATTLESVFKHVRQLLVQCISPFDWIMNLM